MKQFRTIIQFVPSLADGGAETLIKDYAVLLDNEKFCMKILTIYPTSGTANAQRLQESSAEVLSIYPKRNLKWRIWNKLFRGVYVPYRLNKIIREENADILHVHLALLYYVAKIRKFIISKKIFYTCHTLPKKLFQGAMRKEMLAAEKLFSENCFQMIALHENMKKELNEMFDVSNTIVIRNGIDMKHFQNVMESKSQIRETLGISANAFVMGHIGRFSEQKNHKFLIELFREISRQKKNSCLLMIGAGPLEKEINLQLHNFGLDGKYLILSHRADIPQLLKAMDVFVMPSLYEGLGIALVEAQAAGLRCIASDRIPQEAILTEKTIPISLDAPVEEWCRAILDTSKKNICHENLEQYDMNHEIKRLEKLYLGELHE